MRTLSSFRLQGAENLAMTVKHKMSTEIVVMGEKMSFIPKLKVISVWHVQFLPFNRQLN